MTFSHPWDTERHGEWDGILGISGLTKSGKTRVALEYGLTALRAGHHVVFLSNDMDEMEVQRYMARRHAGKVGDFITRPIGGRDVLERIAEYGTRKRLVIIDQVDFTVGGMSIRRGFEAMRFSHREHECSFIVTVAAKKDVRGLPYPRARTLQTDLGVVMGLRWGDGEFPGTFVTEETSDEGVIQNVERRLMGEKLLYVGCLKNRNAEPSATWTCVDYTTMEKVGEIIGV